MEQAVTSATSHNLESVNIPVAQEKFNQLPAWQRDMVAVASGVGDFIYDNWQVITVVAILAGITVAIILSWGSLSPALAPIALLLVAA